MSKTVKGRSAAKTAEREARKRHTADVAAMRETMTHPSIRNPLATGNRLAAIANVLVASESVLKSERRPAWHGKSQTTI